MPCCAMLCQVDAQKSLLMAVLFALNLLQALYEVSLRTYLSIHGQICFWAKRVVGGGGGGGVRKRFWGGGKEKAHRGGAKNTNGAEDTTMTKRSQLCF